MAFVRVHAILIATHVKKRFPWSKPEVIEIKREGFLALNLALCAEIIAFSPNQHGVPLEITKIDNTGSTSQKWVPHVDRHDYVEMIRAMEVFGLADLVRPHQTIIYTT